MTPVEKAVAQWIFACIGARRQIVIPISGVLTDPPARPAARDMGAMRGVELRRAVATASHEQEMDRRAMYAACAGHWRQSPDVKRKRDCQDFEYPHISIRIFLIADTAFRVENASPDSRLLRAPASPAFPAWPFCCGAITADASSARRAAISLGDMAEMEHLIINVSLIYLCFTHKPPLGQDTTARNVHFCFFNNPPFRMRLSKCTPLHPSA